FSCYMCILYLSPVHLLPLSFPTRRSSDLLQHLPPKFAAAEPERRVPRAYDLVGRFEVLLTDQDTTRPQPLEEMREQLPVDVPDQHDHCIGPVRESLRLLLEVGRNPVDVERALRGDRCCPFETDG